MTDVMWRPDRRRRGHVKRPEWCQGWADLVVGLLLQLDALTLPAPRRLCDACGCLLLLPDPEPCPACLVARLGLDRAATDSPTRPGRETTATPPRRTR